MRNGRVQASYVADDGRRYYAAHTYDTRMDAEGWLANERRLIESGDWTPPDTRAATKLAGTVLLREYVNGWLLERDLTPKTRALYADLLNSRILPVLGEEMLRNVSPGMVRAWWIGLGKATPTRNAHAYQLLRTIFNTAVADKVVSENPCQIKSAGKAPKPRDVRPLTPDELEQVADAVPEKYRAAVPVAAWCGLRFGELIELRRKDVYTVDGNTVLRIRRVATRVGNRIEVGPPKTDAGIRDVTVPPHVAETLRRHMRVNTGQGPESFLFTTTRGQRLSTTAFTKAVKVGFANVGKPEMRVHDLRHVGATLAAQAGATTKELMRRIGHTTPAMAMRYQIAADERDAAIAREMTRLAGPHGSS
ncbi:site-specific integrase [Mycolicibacterium pulveris]|nr:site-specific integrase [Mycolicibacterium pulveris]